MGIFGAATTATAATVIDLTLEEVVDAADRIIMGDVIDVSSQWNPEDTLIVTQVTVEPSVTIMGDPKPVDRINLIGGTVGELTLMASDMPVFAVGDSLILFLKDDDTIVGSFQGAYYTNGVDVGRSAGGVRGVDDSTVTPLREFVDEVARIARVGAPSDKQIECPGAVLPHHDRYALIGPDWTYEDEPMEEDFYINPNCADASAGPIQNQIAVIFLGSSAWSDAGANFAFSFGGITASTSDAYDSENNVFFCPAGNCGMAPTTLAVTHIWFSGGDILEFDMAFNDSNHEFWDGMTGACGGTRYDIQAVATHEFGHALGLDHSLESDATMWLSIPPCELGPRTLHQDDIDGVNAIYGVGGSPFLFIGGAAGDRLGLAVSTAGDINNDGIDDIIVGAPYNDDNGTNAGKVFIYAGDSGLLLDTIEGAGDGYQFGFSVAYAGDVNGDGRDDIIVGAPYASNSRGRAYVYSGVDRSLLYARSGNSGSTERFGFSVAANLDVDADGFSDFIISSPYSDESGSNAGKVRVYSGRDGAMLAQFYGENSNDNFGWAVCGIGRINGDANDEFLVGAPNNDDAGSNCGKAYIYSGRHLRTFYTLTGYQNGSQFGRGVGHIGIVDDDGYDDFVVGSPYYDRDDKDKAGRMDIFSGRYGTKMYSKKGELAEDRLGWALAAAGDVDEDGVDDILIGSPRNSTVSNTRGRVYIRNGITGNLIAQFDGDASGDQLGYSVSAINDINGDGLPDLIMGAPYNDYVGEKSGRAYVDMSDDRAARSAVDTAPGIELVSPEELERDRIKQLLKTWMEGGMLADLNDDGRLDDADLTLIMAGRLP